MSSLQNISLTLPWYVPKNPARQYFPTISLTKRPRRQALLDDIINAVNVLADRAIDSVERLLVSLPAQSLGFTSKKRARDESNGTEAAVPEEAAAKREIENGTHQLETLLNTAIDKNFDIFELYTMKNILTVKHADQPYVRLAHYDGLDLDAAQGPDAPTTESVTQLRRRVQASQRLHVALEAERVRNDALLKKLRAALGVKSPGRGPAAAAVKKEEGEEEEEQGVDAVPVNSLGFLRDRGTLEQGGSVKPITTTAEFTLSQMQSLRSLSASLRTILPKMEEEEEEEGEGEGSGRKKTWRRERAEYVEGASRRYLETETGLELGPGGEVRDGQWQGSGRGMAKDEVEGMERVVAVLGASGPGEAKEAEAETEAGAEEAENEMDES
jgi:kinetochore protein Mis12/MTW1